MVNKVKKYRYLFIVRPVSCIVPLFLLSLLASCGQPPAQQVVTQQPAAKLLIYTVNYPLAYFAEQIGGENVEVVFPAPGAVDPAFWQPSAEDILGYQAADLILLNGAGYAKWLSRASLPGDGLVDTSSGFSDQYIAVTGNVRHRHGPEGAHEHGEVAFTTWLDPEFAVLQAEAVRAAMASVRPELAAEFQAGYDALISDLATWDANATRVFAGLNDAIIVFSHPVYQYLARHYDIGGQTVMWESDEAIGADELRVLGRFAGAEGQRNILIWESEPLPGNRAAVATQGFESVVFDPLGNRPESGDYLTGMDANVERLLSLKLKGSTDD